MKKLILTYAKKSLSLVMAFMMLLSCWVFVAPEAEAATTAKYSFTLTYNLPSGDSGGDITVYYYNFKDDGSGVDTSSSGNEYVVDSYGKLSTGDGQTYTHNCAGFPYKIVFSDKEAGCGSSNRTLRVTGFSINGTAVSVGSGFNVDNTTQTMTYNASEGYSSITWSLPTVSSISLSPTSATANVPDSGSGSAKITATVKDQYGYSYHKLTTSHCSMNPQVTGISTTVSNNVITVSGTKEVFDNISGYNSSTGKATSTLSVLMGNSGTKTATVTFQSPTYTVAFNDACGTVHNKTCYYNGSVTAPTACAKSPTETQHFKFSSWSDTTFSGIKANKSVTANYTGTNHTFDGDWVYNGDGTHSKKCTSVDADATCTVVGFNGKSYANGGYGTCSGTWGGDDSSHSMSCTLCSGTQTHTPTWEEVADAEYSANGDDDNFCVVDEIYYKSCSVCGKAHSTETFIHKEAEGHDFSDYDHHVNHTCTEAGYDVYYCKNCTETNKNYDTFGGVAGTDPAAHSWANSLSDKGDGTHGYKCTVCGNAWNEVNGHVWTLADADIITAPTCVDAGEGVYRCTCGATKTDVIEADGVSHKYLDAAPNNDGTHSAICEYCNDEIKDDCVDEKTDCECDVCGYKIPHVYDKEVATDTYKASDATCTAKATYYYSCQCGEKGTATFESGEPLGHDYTEESSEVKSPADCENAQTNWYGCSRCDANAKDDADAADKFYEVGEALGHEATDELIALADGKHGYKCVRYDACNTTLNDTTCTYTNYTDNGDGKHTGTCVCGNEDKDVHEMSDWVSDDKDAQADGTHSRECTVCGYVEKNKTCNYETTVTPATCTTGTITTYTCSDCGHGYSVNDGVKNSANHVDNSGAAYGTWTDESTVVASTCTVPGKDADEKCLGCDAVITTGAERELDYTEHGNNKTSVEGYIEATCTIEGHTGKVVCDGCKKTITEDTNVGINENNHKNKTSHALQNPTCEKDGYTAYETCDDCDAIIGKDIIPMLGHNYNGEAVKLDGDVHAYKCERYDDCQSTGIGAAKGETEACSGGTATCTALANCAVCGDTWGVLAKHVFEGEYAQVSGKDEHYRQCLSCDAYGLGTTYTVGETEACSGGTATCLDKAECALCGGEHGEPLGHDYSADADRINQPEEGYHNYKCSRCDAYGIVENGVQLDGGKIACYDAEPVRTAQTCTEAAYYTHTCDTCSYVWVVTGTSDDDAALGHDYTEKLANDAHKKSDADCENAAVYWYDCSRCDKNAMDETDTDKYTDLTYTNGSALGHKFEGRTEYLYKATDASCTANETYYVYCTVCKKSSKGTDSVATFVKYDTALEHQYAEIVDEDDLTKNLKTEATCNSAAVYYKSCSVCDAKGTETFSYGDALGHTFTEKVMDAAHKITDANCKTAATYWYDCSVCTQNAKLVDKTGMTDDEVAALKYTDGELNPNKHVNLVDVALKLPTCTEDGHSAYQKCDCGAEIGKVTEGYEKKEHNFTGAYIYDAETDTHQRACLNNCGTYSEAADCSFGAWKQSVDADGKATHTRECVCGNTETGDCAGGTATCLKKAECSTCGKTYGDTLEHKYPETWTSTGKGTHTKACQNGCGVDLTEACSGGTATCKDKAVCDTCKVAYGETTSHTFETYVKISDAKCGVNAKEKATCKYCDATDEREIAGTALKHAMGDYTTDSEYAKEPTCKDEGIEVSCCTREGCDYYVTRTIPADKDAHVWGEWTVIGGDCATGITEERVCSVCEETEDRKNYDVEHNYKEVARVKATCLVDGYIEYVCTNCNFTYVYDNTVEGFPGKYSELKAKGEHTWGDVIETKAPTCAHEGRGYQICTVCNAQSDSVTIAKLGHGWEDGDDRDNDYIYHAPIDATCDTDGHSGYYECTQCATGKTEPDVIFKATGHADKDGDGKCDGCSGEIYDDNDKTKSCGCICHKDNWFMQLIYKIVRFFWKLFKIGKSCDCGFVHY